MLEKLTQKQLNMIPKIRDKWLGYLLNYKQRINEKKAIKGIEWLYKLSGLKKPMIIFCDSPMGCQIGAEYSIQLLEYLSKLKENQVRDQVGDQVRTQVRDQVWAQVRDQVGDQVGDQVWAQVWDQVWDQVRTQVRDQVGDQVRDQVRTQVRDQVGDQVRDQVWDQVRDQVGDQVRDQVADQVRTQVGDQVGDQVWAQVWDQVWDQVHLEVQDKGWNKIEFRTFCYYGSVSDYAWLGFYDYFDSIGIKLNNTKFNKFKKLSESGIYDMIQLDGLCVVSQMPTEIHRDNNLKLNNYKDMAIKWSDGWGLYFIHGVCFTEKEFKKFTSKGLKPKEVLNIENIEKRMVILKMRGVDFLINNTNSKLLDKSKRGNELYIIKNTFSTLAYYLKYKCPSTSREYISGIDPEIGRLKDADKAMAWKFNITKKEYVLNLRIES